MYEELYERIPDVSAYMERIGLAGERINTDREGLDRLIHAQLTHIAFEDMDVWGRGECPDLGIGALFDKIVLRRRGGYCFELNSLFCALLKELGFEAYMVAAHVMAERDFLPPPSHCAVVCVVDGRKLFCDVGFGGPVPDGSLGFDGERRFGFLLERNGLFWELYFGKDGERSCQLCFKDVPADPVELIPANYYISQNTDSPFRNVLHVNLRLPKGSASIVDHEFKLRLGGEREERYIEAADIPAILEEYFGIPASEVTLRDIEPFAERTARKSGLKNG